MSEIGVAHQSDPYGKIVAGIKQLLPTLDSEMSQWETDQELDRNTCDYRITVKHRYDPSIEVGGKVYPFNASKKLYQVKGQYVKASCGGKNILEAWDGKRDNECLMIDNEEKEKIKIVEIPSQIRISCLFRINASIYVSGASSFFGRSCNSIYDKVYISCSSSIDPSSSFSKNVNCPKYYVTGDTRDYVLDEINNKLGEWFQATLSSFKEMTLEFVETQKSLVETLYDTDQYDKQITSRDSYCTMHRYTGVSLCNGDEVIYFNKK